MNDRWSRARAGRVPPVAIGGITAGIFVFDVAIGANITAGVLYVAVVLLAASHGNRATIVIVSAVCATLTITAYLLASGGRVELVGAANIGLAIIAIAATTYLVLRGQATQVSLRERASLLELSHDPVFARTTDDVITYWNRAAEELYGWTSDEAIGLNVHKLLMTTSPEHLDKINAALQRTGRWEGELTHRRGDGTEVTVASRWSLHRDQQGRPAAILETNNDITEHKRAQDSLRERASLLDLSHDAVFVRNLGGVITYWNHASKELYGWTSEEAVEQRVDDLLHAIFPEPYEDIVRKLRRTGHWEGEVIHHKRDGMPVTVASRWSVHRNEEGRAAAVLETNNDITAHKRARDALEQAQSDLARFNRIMVMGELTASISHEINQPISGTMNNANAALNWLAADPPNLEQVRKSIDGIIANGNRAREVITRVRALVRKAPPRKAPLDLNETVGEVLALTHRELQGNSVNLALQLSRDLPLAPADRIQLQQVIINLVVNAIEAMNKCDGPRELSITTGRDSNNLFVEVRDTGPGFEAADYGQLFNSFYTTKPDGMGMGLSLSRSIIEAHGGRLSAEPNEPHGAVLQLTLPILDPSAAEEGA